MAPPSVPDSAFHSSNVALFKLTTWKKTWAIAVIAGLLTDPQYYANGIRLDWLQRLVFSKAEGKRKPSSEELSHALNAGLERAKVLRLEDPSEELFCNILSTVKGAFRIFTGQWETPGPYTQTLLDAFHALPDGPSKQDALRLIYSALKLSDALAERCGVVPLTETSGSPQDVMPLPNLEGLRRLARRVTFTDVELAQLGIEKATLQPFMIEPRHFPFVSDRLPGDTPLEFYPLLGTANGLVVASPAAISLAVRATLVRAAKMGGMEDALLYELLKSQETFSQTTCFWPMHTLNLSPPDEHFLRGSICEFSRGHYLQIIQLPVTFSEFPEAAFGTAIDIGDAVARSVAHYVHEFWILLARRTDYRRGVTVLLSSGWGTPHSMTPPLDEEQEPMGWQFLHLSFADTAVLGACEDGKLSDVIRILRQVARLEEEGFEFHYANGILNLFGFWKLTKGNLIPEHHLDIEPPCNLQLPTDDLLQPRTEATQKVDLHALPLPGDGFRTVQRIEWTDRELKPIYGSIDDVMNGRLLGCVAFNRHVWWVGSTPKPDENREWCYRVWYAALQWLAAVGPHLTSTFPHAFPAGAFCVDIVIPAASAFERIDPRAPPTQALSTTVALLPHDGTHTRHLRIAETWLAYLPRPENDAEIEFVATLAEALSDAAHPMPRAEFGKHILGAIGSRDWRWLHAQRAITPMERLAGHGLVETFHRIPFSAVSYAKCGSIWAFHPRSEGCEINGEEKCGIFLANYHNQILNKLINDIQGFNRQQLVTAAAACYQSARVEQQRWRGTIRALRAISGAAADANAFVRQNEINAVQRAAKSVCEIAACEAQEAGGLIVGRIELDELFAKALLLFANGQRFASIRAGLVKPELRISPAGDLLSDRSIFDVTLRPAAEWFNNQALSEAARAYGRGSDENVNAETDGKLPWDGELRRAVEAEYSDSAEAFFDLQYALLQLAEAKQRGEFIVKSSELAVFLDENQGFPNGDHRGLLERLTLPRRSSWLDRTLGLTESDFNLSRFDRRYSLINRPLLAVTSDPDPMILVAPLLVADAAIYSVSGLMDGTLNNEFWVSQAARKYAGSRGKAAGEAFEESVASALRSLNLKAWSRCKLSWALNQKVDDGLGDVDVMAISPDRKRVWVIEAKNLRLCRTEAEVAARLSEYRGRMTRDAKGRDAPDKMLRHIRRVEYVRARREALCPRLSLTETPNVKGLLIVDSPQPMNFYMLEKLEDGESAFLDNIGCFEF